VPLHDHDRAIRERRDLHDFLERFRSAALQVDTSVREAGIELALARQFREIGSGAADEVSAIAGLRDLENA
jgi:hypothetical protein